MSAKGADPPLSGVKILDVGQNLVLRPDKAADSARFVSVETDDQRRRALVPVLGKRRALFVGKAVAAAHLLGGRVEDQKTVLHVLHLVDSGLSHKIERADPADLHRPHLAGVKSLVVPFHKRHRTAVNVGVTLLHIVEALHREAVAQGEEQRLDRAGVLLLPCILVVACDLRRGDLGGDLTFDQLVSDVPHGAHRDPTVGLPAALVLGVMPPEGLVEALLFLARCLIELFEKEQAIGIWYFHAFLLVSSGILNPES